MKYVERLMREIVCPDHDDLFWNTHGNGMTISNGSAVKGWIYGHILVNDCFYYASADCERIELEEIDDLVDCCNNVDDGVNLGSLYWVAKKRNLRPLHQLLDKMSPEKRRMYLGFVDPYAEKHPKTGKLMERYHEELIRD